MAGGAGCMPGGHNALAPAHETRHQASGWLRLWLRREQGLDVRANLEAQQAEQQIDAGFDVRLGEHERQANAEAKVGALLRSDCQRARDRRR